MQHTQLIHEKIKDTQDFIINFRRSLHKIPEYGFQEKKTATFITDRLKEFGFSPKTGIAGTGITACLDTGRPGPCLMLRADMDGLLVKECTGLSFSSEHENMMHACAHDGHMAMLLGAAKVLVALQDKLCGKILFLFQPAEETPGGALPMIAEGVLEGVDFCFGAHIWPSVPEGCLGIRQGYLMAATDCIDLAVFGSGGHSSQPHLCKNALEIGIELIQGLNRIVRSELDPLSPTTFNICAFQAGTTYNVIADKAEIKGGLRTFTEKNRVIWEKRSLELIEQTEKFHGIKIKTTILKGHKAVDNAACLTKIVTEAAISVVGQGRVVEPELVLAGEDFACYQEKVPGYFFFIGSGTDKKELLHTSNFDFNEDILSLGVELFCQTVFRMSSKEANNEKSESL